MNTLPNLTLQCSLPEGIALAAIGSYEPGRQCSWIKMAVYRTGLDLGNYGPWIAENDFGNLTVRCFSPGPGPIVILNRKGEIVSDDSGLEKMEGKIATSLFPQDTTSPDSEGRVGIFLFVWSDDVPVSEKNIDTLENPSHLSSLRKTMEVLRNLSASFS